MVIVMILSWMLFGFIVGAIARAIYPGPQPMGFGSTTLLGIAGSFFGGLLGNVIVGLPLFTFHAAGLIGSVIGALLVMTITSLSLRNAHA